MKDIELVIKIPKEAYEQIIEVGELDYLEVITAIENGIPLQKIYDEIRAEIEEQKEDHCFDDDDMYIYKTGLNDAIDIIDKQINMEEDYDIR